MAGQLLLSFLTLFVASVFHATAFAADSEERDDSVNVTGTYSDSIFASNRRVDANFDATDDVFLAGGKIVYGGRTTENAFLAGGNLSLRGPKARMMTGAGGEISIERGEFQDLILAGGEIHINESHIVDDAVLAGGSIEILKGSSIGGTSKIYGGEILFAGNGGTSTLINGGEVTLRGQFAGNVEVHAEELTIDPTAVIRGNLIHSTRELEISPGAQILGRTEALPVPSRGSGWAFGAFLFLLGSLIAPALVVLAFPRIAETGRIRIQGHFWDSVGKGVITLILAPLLLILLFMSVVGIQVGLFAIPFVFAAFILAWAVAVYTIGDKLRNWLQRAKDRGETKVPSRKARFGWTVLGTLATLLIFIFPFFGFVFCLLLFLAGLGALYAPMAQRSPAPPTASEQPTTGRWVPSDSRA